MVTSALLGPREEPKAGRSFLRGAEISVTWCGVTLLRVCLAKAAPFRFLRVTCPGEHWPLFRSVSPTSFPRTLLPFTWIRIGVQGGSSARALGSSTASRPPCSGGSRPSCRGGFDLEPLGSFLGLYRLPGSLLCSQCCSISSNWFLTPPSLHPGTEGSRYLNVDSER